MKQVPRVYIPSEIFYKDLTHNQIIYFYKLNTNSDITTTITTTTVAAAAATTTADTTTATPPTNTTTSYMIQYRSLIYRITGPGETPENVVNNDVNKNDTYSNIIQQLSLISE